MREFRGSSEMIEIARIDLSTHDVDRARRDSIRARCLDELSARYWTRQVRPVLQPVWNRWLVPAAFGLTAFYLTGVFWNSLSLFR